MSKKFKDYEILIDKMNRNRGCGKKCGVLFLQNGELLESKDFIPGYLIGLYEENYMKFN